jgi:hypothetical protein
MVSTMGKIGNMKNAQAAALEGGSDTNGNSGAAVRAFWGLFKTIYAQK